MSYTITSITKIAIACAHSIFPPFHISSFYCIVVAQRISRTSSRLFLDYHNKALAAAREAIERGDIMDVYDVSSVEDKRVDNDQEEPTQGEGRIGKVGQNRQSTNSLCCTVTTEADGDTTIENYGSIHAASNFNEMAAVPEEEGEEGEASETRKYFRGQLGVLFGGLTVLTLGIIGCIFAPSLAIEISDLWGLILESEATHRDAISDYGVFSIVTAILLKTRFVLDSTWDYVALGFLMTVGVISIGGVFFMSCYRVIQILLDKGWAFFQDQGSPLYYQLPSYLRLYAYKHIEIYVVAVVIGCWQLGAVSIYAIHLYCSILNTVYKLLSYIGLAERPSAECFPIQMTQPDNLLVFLGSFCILLANFVVQVFTQYRKNIREASHSLHQQEHDMERLSTLWNAPSSNIGSVRDEGKEQTRRALHLNQTASFSDDDDDDGGGNDSSNSDASASTTSFVSVRSSSPLVLKHKNEGSSSD